MADKANQMGSALAPYSARSIAICVSLLSTFVSGPLALLAVGWYLWAMISVVVDALIAYAFPGTRFLIKSEERLQFILFRVTPVAYVIELISLQVSDILSRIVGMIAVFVITGQLLRFGKSYIRKHHSRG